VPALVFMLVSLVTPTSSFPFQNNSNLDIDTNCVFIFLQSLLRIINLRKYNGNVQIIPAPGYESIGVPLTQTKESSDQHDDPSLSLGGQMGSDKTLLSKRYRGPSVSYEESNWRLIEGPFVYVWLNNVPWCSQDAMPAPEAKVGEMGC
jgi:sphingosine kinase